MRITVLLFITLLFPSRDNPKIFFGDKYEDGLKFYKKNLVKINKVILQEKGNHEIVMSIVFPELIRYSMWRDMIETSANELLYVNQGLPAGQFSIGRFQIKPSFVEKLENSIKNDPLFSKDLKYIYTYNSNNSREMRSERLNRLKDIDWQLKYVTSFCKVVESRFKIQQLSTTEKIAFLSSAFNHSFHCDSLEIVKWKKIKTFPYGIKYDNPFSYSDVALYFYQNDLKGLIK